MYYLHIGISFFENRKRISDFIPAICSYRLLSNVNFDVILNIFGIFLLGVLELGTYFVFHATFSPSPLRDFLLATTWNNPLLRSVFQQLLHFLLSY